MNKRVVLSALLITISCFDNQVSATNQKELKVKRKPTYQIDPLFLNRRSAYALSGEAVTHEELMKVFEAGRWAPSSYNSQPWRFIYAKKGMPAWQKFMNLMVEFNQEWTQFADVLVVVVSKDTFDHDGSYSRTHSLDAGAAWQNMGLQATELGLVAHGMSGFDYEKAKKDLQVPDGYSVEMMFALGRPGVNEKLSEDFKKRDATVSQRKPLEELVFEGAFRK